MNYVAHLNSFYRLVPRDPRLRSQHISLYMALFQRWNEARFARVFTIKRESIMKTSAIRSKNTYHKTIRELHEISFIYYQPPLNKFCLPKVTIRSLTNNAHPQPEIFSCTENDMNSVPDVVHTCIENGTVCVPDMVHTSTENDTAPVPYMGHINKHINNLKNSVNGHSAPPVHENPGSASVAAYCREKKYSLAEAKKFFLHFESTGWTTGNRTPIVNWKAAADKWMLNILPRKTTLNSGNTYLDTPNDKDYSQPL